MQKVTLAYNEEEIYEIEDCRNLDFLICKGSLIKITTCESEILNKKESDKCQAVPIRCPVQEVFQIPPKAIYMFFNKTTEVFHGSGHVGMGVVACMSEYNPGDGVCGYPGVFGQVTGVSC
ncbi:unnamed protein product [Pieris brassicae]|uniref:Uncharacterized protein n=1 Tax=Pieris brassicae TaxID=7116 RepID=A0A9P0TQP0_PIEBR|nr:unnamed protein product [Pieris brassicae]